ncbi:hypothetical protein [Bacillus sp. FJAT-49736]|uniref:hypothetical protein n=1 Tax=Bacillus sp. FJAT-49736 TaxID=2833582 RepID=UPI001BC992AC|nr:hypothetical protein [Bacillus sp. FJAT-49736]MBS4173579.1 hypothetical protein [Bacillus sp. FJAT-49736]
MEAIIFAIIIGIIGALANKKKLEKPKNTKEAPKPMDFFGNAKKTIEENMKKFTLETAPEQVKKVDTDVPEDTVYRDAYLDAEIQADRLKTEEDYYQKKIELMEKQSVKLEQDDPLSLSSSNDLLKGIILAEVLGPPRSKKPYSRR